MIGKHITYTGRVQGVGFRYTTQQIAGGFPQVAGYVRNLPDGQVELVAEGHAGQVEAFLQTLANRMRDYIVETRIHVREPMGLRGFEIRY